MGKHDLCRIRFEIIDGNRTSSSVICGQSGLRDLLHVWSSLRYSLLDPCSSIVSGVLIVIWRNGKHRKSTRRSKVSFTMQGSEPSFGAAFIHIPYLSASFVHVTNVAPRLQNLSTSFTFEARVGRIRKAYTGCRTLAAAIVFLKRPFVCLGTT